MMNQIRSGDKKKWKMIWLFVIGWIVASPSYAQSEQQICLDQVGFYPAAPKQAIITGTQDLQRFYLLSVDNDTVFIGELGPLRKSLNSSTSTRVADFSRFTKNGKFRLYVPGAGLSYPFLIRAHVHGEVARASLKGYYYQRTSMPLDKEYAGDWQRPSGHPDTAVLIHPSAADSKRPAGTVINSPGGWYDAGDYNKYVVNSGITMGTLLAAYEDFTKYFDTLKTNIPESKNAIPDILDEVLYNLRWMLTMQDPADGGVYHKCTNAGFDGMVMPGLTKLPRYMVAKGTAATLDFVAVTAQCHRIFKKFEKQLPGLADSCLRAAEKGWQWALKNPAVMYDQNKINQVFEPKITTGAYGDRSVHDEWFWAAAEMACSVKGAQYDSLLNAGLGDSLSIPTWGQVQMLGFYTIIRHAAQMPMTVENAIPSLKQRVIAFADSYDRYIAVNAFNMVMGRSVKDFNWGSNSNAANQGILMIQAYLLTKNKKYLYNALSNLDYLMGRNATGYCFVTGFGSKSPMHPHHRPSVADGIEAPIPGLLVGGPNPGMQDKCTYAFTEPETAYTDLACSYASNEIAINWNAPLVYLANALEAAF